MPSAQKTHSDERRAFRVNDAVRTYGVGRSKLYDLIKTGELAAIKVGGRRLIPRDALEALLQKGAA
jgi:excisionase family DNA binding protein